MRDPVPSLLPDARWGYPPFLSDRASLYSLRRNAHRLPGRQAGVHPEGMNGLDGAVVRWSSGLGTTIDSSPQTARILVASPTSFSRTSARRPRRSTLQRAPHEARGGLSRFRSIGTRPSAYATAPSASGYGGRWIGRRASPSYQCRSEVQSLFGPPIASSDRSKNKYPECDGPFSWRRHPGRKISGYCGERPGHRPDVPYTSQSCDGCVPAQDCFGG